MTTDWDAIVLVVLLCSSAGLILCIFLFAVLKNRFVNRAMNYPYEIAMERMRQGFWLPAIAYVAAICLGAAAYFATLAEWIYVFFLIVAGFVIIEFGGMSHALTWRRARREWLKADAQTLAANLEHIAANHRSLALTPQEIVTASKTIKREHKRLEGMVRRGPDSLHDHLEHLPHDPIQGWWSKHFWSGGGLFGAFTTADVARGANRWGKICAVSFCLTAAYFLLLLVWHEAPLEAWLRFVVYICFGAPVLYMATRGHLIGDARARVLLSMDLQDAERSLRRLTAIVDETAPLAPVSRLKRIKQALLSGNSTQ
jgi:hypothetical protein